TKEGDFLAKDFIFEVVFVIPPEQHILVAGFGDGYRPQASKKRIQFWIEKPVGPVLFSTTEAQEHVVGRMTKAESYMLRMDKRGNAFTFSILAESEGKFTEIMKRTIADLKSFAAFLNDKNAFLYLGNSFKLKQMRLKVVPIGALPDRIDRSGSK